MRHLFFIFWISSLFSNSTDFDVVVVGSSPFSLLEALYHYHTGNRVLILEQSNDCGGAWKSLDVCGIPHADLGCHQIGHDPALLHFLEKWVGCKMVSLDNPLFPYMHLNNNGYYFSQGSYELIDHLLKLIRKTEIVFLLDHRLESVNIDPSQILATIKTNGREFTASKIIVPIYSHIKIENHPTIPLLAQEEIKSQFQHLYILIEDPSPPRFIYYGSPATEISRMMNLTDFVHLTQTGKQLIVFQYYGDLNPQTASTFVDHLKSKDLISPEARIVSVDSYIYEQSYHNQELVDETPNGSAIFEVLNTSHILNLSQYIPKWKTVLAPYKEAIGEDVEE